MPVVNISRVRREVRTPLPPGIEFIVTDAVPSLDEDGGQVS
jgi:hypothetical protein